MVSLIASSELCDCGDLRLSANYNAKICYKFYCNALLGEYCLIPFELLFDRIPSLHGISFLK